MSRPTHQLADGSLVWPEGYDPADLTLIPTGFWEPRDLEAARAAALAKVDRDAEATRMLFLTPGEGQALTYQQKQTEARAWAADADPNDFPMLAAEASATDTAIADVVTAVIAQADAWAITGAAIEGARMGAKKAIREATDIAAIESMATVDWGSVPS